MKLKIQREGETLYEVNSDDITDKISIGRSHECTWTLPNSEEKASRRHAVLFRRDDQLVIRDLQSANGTYCDGKQITEKNLRPGDRITIGKCCLSVEKDATASLARAPHLVVCTGDMRGRKLPLGPTFTIGSDPSASLTIADPLVSRLHAEIRLEEGGYVVRDLDSRNGTALNSHKLEKGEEARLKAGDRIYAAHYCLRFDDGSLSRQTVVQYGAGAAALLLILLSAVCIRSCRPNPSKRIERAYAYAEDDRLNKALRYVEKADRGRLSDEEKTAIAEAQKRIGDWQRSHGQYTRLCASVESGNLERCRDLLTSLDVEHQDLWAWGPSGAALMDKAGIIADLMAAHDASEAAVKAETSYPEDLKKVEEALRNALAKARLAKPPPDLGLLIAGAETVLHNLTTRTSNSQFYTELDRLRAWPPDIAGVERALRLAQKHESESVRRQAAALLPPLEELARAMKSYRSVEDQLMDLNAGGVLETEIDLPPRDRFHEPRMLACRQVIADRAAQIRVCAKALSDVLSFAGTPDLASRELAAWQDRKALTDVLSCDALQQGAVAPDRAEPGSQYDRYLGVENFHRFCAVDLAGQMLLSPAQTPFPTIVSRTAAFLAAAREFVKASDGMGDDWTSGQLATMDRLCRSLPGEQRRIAEKMAADAGAMSGRQSLIATVIAIQIGTGCEPPLEDMDALRKRAAALFLEIEAKTRELTKEYRAAAPENKRSVGRQILETGLPGDPRVDQVWAALSP